MQALNSQLGSLKARFDESLLKHESLEQAIENYRGQNEAYESKIKQLSGERAEAKSALDRIQRDFEDLQRSNEGFEKENINLVRERNTNL